MEQNKSTVEGQYLPEAGGAEAEKIATCLAKAKQVFFEELQKAGIEPIEAGGGGYDRGGCGHDRS